MHAKLETASTDHWGPDLKPIAVSYVRLSSTKLAGHGQLVISGVIDCTWCKAYCTFDQKILVLVLVPQNALDHCSLKWDRSCQENNCVPRYGKRGVVSM
jgi:hypothetical protein